MMSFIPSNFVTPGHMSGAPGAPASSVPAPVVPAPAPAPGPDLFELPSNAAVAVAAAAAAAANFSANGGSLAACKRCGGGGCDLKVLDCGCYLHARCAPVLMNSPVTHCSVCHSPTRALQIMPMNFDEIDGARAAAASMSPSDKRGKKRKNATIARLNPVNAAASDEKGNSDGSELRTGRWTSEETLYCDKLIDAFENGHLPIVDGIKLNDFLANMLKSKQSRLTKKMKNARLSAKTYTRTTGYIPDTALAIQFSELEVSFYESIQCDLERSEIRFHMQKEWRELFSNYCVAIGQPLDADLWLSSVEEMDRRVSQAKDAARMERRKVMMGYALSQDSLNPERGVFIDRISPSDFHSSTEDLPGRALSSNSVANQSRDKRQKTSSGKKSMRNFSSPFVGKVVQYLHRHNIPFEHIDVWVPSFVPAGTSGAPSTEQPDQKCRLCFAGFATTDSQIPHDGGRPIPLNDQDQFDLLSFGDYSQKFSFDVGCGLPGRVYSSGICSWEQGIENAPSSQFERCGGASQWGIKTVLGIPIPSPNVGRIVVLLYSRHDRRRDPEMVRRITEELTKLMPTPKWKLVVDTGATPPRGDGTKPLDPRVVEVLNLMSEHAPLDKNSLYASYLPGFTSLRLMLMKQTKTDSESELLSTILDSYSSYLSSGRNKSDTAWMIARDFMLLTQASNSNSAHQVARSLSWQSDAAAGAQGAPGLTSGSRPPSQMTTQPTIQPQFSSFNQVIAPQQQPLQASQQQVMQQMFQVHQQQFFQQQVAAQSFQQQQQQQQLTYQQQPHSQHAQLQQQLPQQMITTPQSSSSLQQQQFQNGLQDHQNKQGSQHSLLVNNFSQPNSMFSSERQGNQP